MSGSLGSMSEPGRLISFRVANGEEASIALLDGLTELCWSGKKLIKKKDANAAEASQQLLQQADPINGMDFFPLAGVAGTQVGVKRRGTLGITALEPADLAIPDALSPHCTSLQVTQIVQSSLRMRP